MRKPKKQQARIKCSCDSEGKRHHVVFDSGRAVSSGCGDVTEEAGCIASMMRLGAWRGEHGSCAALAALVMHGCEMILRRTGDEEGFVSIAGWEHIYIRFETLGVVERQMRRTRDRLRRERRKAAKESAA